MTVFLAWTPVAPPADLPGPWRELREAADGLLLVDSDDTLSRVFHELKWSLPDGTPLLVVPLDHRPKLRGLRPGAQAWLRDRIGG